MSQKTKTKSMKIRILLLATMMLTACGTKFAKQEATSDEVQPTDSTTINKQKNMEKVINDSNYQEIISQNALCVIDFSAAWCGPCRRIAPIIEELAAEYDGRIEICKCDVDESEELAGKYGVRNIPFVVFLKNGEKVDHVVGAAPKATFVEKCEALLK